MQMSQSLFNQTTALHVSGVTITHRFECIVGGVRVRVATVVIETGICKNSVRPDRRFGWLLREISEIVNKLLPHS